MSARDTAERLRKRRPKEPLVTSEGTLFLRGLSGTERQEYMSKWSGKSGAEALLADQHLVALALCDETGAVVFDNTEEAFAAVCDWSIEDVSAGAKIVLKLSGLLAEAPSEAEKK